MDDEDLDGVLRFDLLKGWLELEVKGNGDHTNHPQPHPEHVLGFMKHVEVFICYITRRFKY